MKREVGLWIDQRKAVIVTISHLEGGIKRMQSNLEKQVLFSGGSSLNGWVSDPEDSKLPIYLSAYYDDIIVCIRDANSIQIFGPDEVKHQLERRLRYERLDDRIVGVETVDKMSERQIEAKIWQHFLSLA